jgi:hypothetical protein
MATAQRNAAQRRTRRRRTVQVGPIDWPMFIPQRERELYASVFAGLAAQRLPFAIGGGLAFSAYTRRWRSTKDLDLYIRPADSEAATDVLKQAGFPDLFEKSKYDRGWSYRGHREGVIVDLLWGMANYRSWVEESWLAGPRAQFEGHGVRLLAAEDLVFAKLYVMQRGRCDWPDLLNILYAVGPEMDWKLLLERVGEDAPVVGGLLSVFAWLCPAEARALPKWLWRRVGLVGPPTREGHGEIHKRAALLGHGDWFGPTEGPVSV